MAKPSSFLQRGWPRGGSSGRRAALKPQWICSLAASHEEALVDPVRIVERRLGDERNVDFIEGFEGAIWG